MVLGGLALLVGVRRVGAAPRAASASDQLLDTTLLRIAQLRAGLSTLVGQQLVLMGTFFVIPVYLQVVLGLDAFETGKRLLPLSVAMLIFALLGPRIAARRSPRTVAQIGLVAVSIGAIVMLGTLDVKLNDTGFKVALALIGAGAGLLASQLGNVIMSSVAPTQTSEAGGLQGTAQNLGSSLGTAIIGAVLLGSLATGFSERIADNPDVPPARARADRRRAPRRGSTSCPWRDVEQRPSTGGLTPDGGAARSPPTTATRSSTRCGCRSAPSRSRRCCRCGSRGGCRVRRSPRRASGLRGRGPRDPGHGPARGRAVRR